MLDTQEPKSVTFGGARAIPSAERRPFLEVTIVPITPETVTDHFPQYAQGGEDQESADEVRQKLAQSMKYWAVAQNPSSNLDVGGIFVNCEQDNLFSVAVNEPYQRRGVSKQLITHAQQIFDHLTLLNTSGLGNEMYIKMGFLPHPTESGKMIWSRSKESIETKLTEEQMTAFKDELRDATFNPVIQPFQRWVMEQQ